MKTFRAWFDECDEDFDLYNFPEEAMELAWNEAVRQTEERIKLIPTICGMPEKHLLDNIMVTGVSEVRPFHSDVMYKKMLRSGASVASMLEDFNVLTRSKEEDTSMNTPNESDLNAVRKEFKLIQNKQSKLSASQRRNVERRYLQWVEAGLYLREMKKAVYVREGRDMDKAIIAKLEETHQVKLV